MIPKIIHYCWFGGNPLSTLAVECIKSWKKYCPDYEIREWSETNFDINFNTYVKEAYAAKKWAFVSDVARLWALVNYGGIYLDTDCELLRPIDEFLELEAVSGFESKTQIPTALMGCREGYELFRDLLAEYDTRRFLLANGEYDLSTNVTAITSFLLKHGLVLNNRLQTVLGFTLYPSEYFCPKNPLTGNLNITLNTHAIHHFEGTWQNALKKCRIEKREIFLDRYGAKLGLLIYIFWAVWYVCRTAGVRSAFKKVGKNIAKLLNIKNIKPK